ncbi:hypothetical protein M011DRAFT_493102 [Sporormia fimetaria CBS 119925]|uniref:Uncharacterized protein n=1 Tax=Sporormia fimetaria CBS 119925 TaxID=1340428 RepID=A0A6A6VHW6_9PLEO|nr:hypothetical protein M011DRAFT_493102 [Sporormia fimetaria CBS 119925]
MSEELDPAEFVQRIRQLGQQRDQQDAERVRKLEEEIIQGRSERLARRAERARSLSPDKPTTPHHTDRRDSETKLSATPTPQMNPPGQEPNQQQDPQQARHESLQRLTGTDAPQSLEDLEPKKPAPNAAALRRSGTLSWQQRRPQSGIGSVRRPLSMAASPERTSAAAQPESQEPSSPRASIPTPSRTQIAQSLGDKDPSWFRQTPDRGIGSAAYRKNQDEEAAEATSTSARRALPGMSPNAHTEPELSRPSLDPSPIISASRAGSVMGSNASSNRMSTSITGRDAESAAPATSPLPVLDSQKLPPPSEQGSSVAGGDQTSSVRGFAMSPTQGRISPERTDRPASPTKGMGGFVQSAMLKRSDSVSKRWSAQPTQPLSRQNSNMSNRNSAILNGFNAARLERPSSLSRDNSVEPSTSRPGSSAGDPTGTRGLRERTATNNAEGAFVRPALPRHSRSKSVASSFSEDNRPPDGADPPSPGKRWSPTKSTWLESALSKPESPKPKLPPPQQPSWMAEISRKKQERGSVDLGSPSQSPRMEDPTSGRTSPIKDIQLRPVGPRTTETPKPKAEPLPSRLSASEKPVLSPKPSLSNKSEAKPEISTEGGSMPEDPTQGRAVVAEKLQVAGSKNETNDTPDTDANSPAPESAPVAKGGNDGDSLPPIKLISSPPPIQAGVKVTGSPSPAVKPKPLTPPKKDFRAGLRTRQVPSEQAKTNELSEFQNVFGRLKKAETKNYVAPDPLKDNILRGKSALTVTGGPKPSVRRDELKESLIAKKTEMLAKAQEEEAIAKRKLLGRSDSISRPTPKDPEPKATIPEALAKRNLLGRSDSMSRPLQSKESEEALANNDPIGKQSFQPKSPPLTDSAKSNKLADRFNPALASLLARGPPSAATPAASRDQPSSTNTPSRTDDASPGPELTHMTKGRARGPKRRAPASKKAASKQPEKPAGKAAPLPTRGVPPETPQKPRVVSSGTGSKPPTPPSKSPELSRKVSSEVSRKAETVTLTQAPPQSSRAASPEVSRSRAKPSSPELLRQKPASPVTPRAAAATVSPEANFKPSKPPSPDVPRKKASLDFSRRASAEAKAVPKKPVEPEVKDTTNSLPTPPVEIGPPNRDVPSNLDLTSPGSRSSVKSMTSMFGHQATPTSPPAMRARSPRAHEAAGLVRPADAVKQHQPERERPASKPFGLGLGSLGSLGGLVAARSRESSPPKVGIANSYPASPPASDRPRSEPFEPSPKAGSTEELLAQFFDEPPAYLGELPAHIDTIQILKTPPLDLGPSGKIRSLRKQINEIGDDGTLLALPPQEEHVLFQDSMYVCTHVFEDATRTRHTEVYLWAGNGVADSIVEDVQIFARNIARQKQGKLVVLRQGKETPHFFEALGGIAITRKGYRPGSKEYMLCGRRHLGHITFDEVTFSLNSLCSGFAYIVKTPSGRIFIWRGRGCSAEELSGARLIAMDLHHTPDLIEIDEGSEPASFFSAFPPEATTPKTPNPTSTTPQIPRSAAHWTYKATSEKYRCRLFKMEQQPGTAAPGWGQGLQVSSFFAPLLRRPSWQSAPAEQRSPQSSTFSPQTPSTTPGTPTVPPVVTKVVEVMPFCQRDLEPECVYVLDAFFEMYIIVGPLSRSQSNAFSTALLFAQDYSILAVSEEDRPFLPVTTVVLEGVPRDMKAVFRSWDDRLIPAAGLMQGKLGRGKSLKILKLEKAMSVARRRKGVRT